jgi:hypothetical protein
LVYAPGVVANLCPIWGTSLDSLLGSLKCFNFF